MRNVFDKKILLDADGLQVEFNPAPIIQSGEIDDIYLKFDVINFTLGVRYKSYCSHISRTIFATPSDDQPNFNFLMDLQKLLRFRTRNIRNLLLNVETIKFENCKISSRCLWRLSQYCPKLKDVQFIYCTLDSNARFNEEFLQSFSLLEHFGYQFAEYDLIPENYLILKPLEICTKLTHFECTDKILWTHKDELDQTNIQLDVLSIHACTSEVHSELFINFIRRAFVAKFFKRLHLVLPSEIENFDFAIASEAISKFPALEKLYVDYEYSESDLSHFENIKELILTKDCPNTNFDKVAKDLKELERVTFRRISFNNITPFFHYCKNLKTFQVKYIDDVSV